MKATTHLMNSKISKKKGLEEDFFVPYHDLLNMRNLHDTYSCTISLLINTAVTGKPNKPHSQTWKELSYSQPLLCVLYVLRSLRSLQILLFPLHVSQLTGWQLYILGNPPAKWRAEGATSVLRIFPIGQCQ